MSTTEKPATGIIRWVIYKKKHKYKILYNKFAFSIFFIYFFRSLLSPLFFYRCLEKLF